MPASYYDDISFDYEKFWEKRKYEHLSESFAIKNLINQIPRRLRRSLIDLGAGFGRLTLTYAPSFKRCFLIDPSRKLTERARKNFGQRRNLRFVVGSGEKIPFKKKKFDAVLMVRVVHHLKDPKKTFREVFRVLRPGGFFILEYANKIHFKARALFFFGKQKKIFSLEPVDIRSHDNLKRGMVPFVNYHPNWLEKLISGSGFELVDKLSVSNFRSGIIKTISPLKLILFLEKNLQRFLGRFSFGPSIFLLLKKPANSPT